MSDPLPTGVANNVVAPVTAITALTFHPPERTDDHDTYTAEDGELDLGGHEVLVQAFEATEIIAHLDHFTKVPKKAVVEIWKDHPPETGGTPVKTIVAKATKEHAKATWTYDPSTPAEKKLGATAWIRAKVDGATHLAHVNLGNTGIRRLRWDRPKPAGAKPGAAAPPTPTLVRPGETIIASCSYASLDPATDPKIEVFSAKDIDWSGHHPKDGATALDTLVVTNDAKAKKLTATWTVQLPDPGDPEPAPPAPMPRAFFLVTLGDRSALSPSIDVMPDVRITLSMGNPNWFMAPLFPLTLASGEGEFEDHLHHPDADPDANRAPWRVLGIKQRLQALGFYYELIPQKPAHPDSQKDPRNRQTRVFRKCVKWYWENVDPKSAPPMKDAGEYDKKEDVPAHPEAGPRIIDVDHADFTDWCHRLEQAVIDQLLVQDPPAAGTPVDLTKDMQVVFPGDFHFARQESLPATTNVDYTRLLNTGPYRRHQGGYDDAIPTVPMDWRNQQEERCFARNPALGKVALVATLEMKKKDGTFVAGPRDGCRVLWKLAPVRDDPPAATPSFPPAPPYIDALTLRDGSRITALHHALSNAAAPAGATGGPKPYLKEVHEHFYDRAPAANADPTWWNSTTDVGGKRARATNVAGSIFRVGGSAAALDVQAEREFPWTSEDASAAHPAHTARHPGSVSVPVAQGKAAVVFAPSHRGGDAYKVVAFVDSPVPPAAGTTSPEILDTKTTGVMTVWRRVRVTRYLQKKIPPGWDATAISEAGGAVDTIQWTNVAAIYKKAFLIIVPPDAPDPVEITLALRDKATRGLVQAVKTICPRTGVNTTNYHELLFRMTGNAALKERPFDPDHLFRLGSDSPYLLEYNDPRAYDLAVAAAPATTARAGKFPYNGYLGLMSDLTEDFLNLLTLFLDDAFDPDNPAAFDAVPAPGLLCVQSLYGDNVTPVLVPEEILYWSLNGVPANGDTPVNMNGDLQTATGCSAGDTLSVVRWREQAFDDASANAPWNNDPANIPAVNSATLPVFKHVDFIYGGGAGQNGTTFQNLADFLALPANVAALCRDPANVDLEFFPREMIGTTGIFFAYHLKNLFSTQWHKDGLRLELQLKQGVNAPLLAWRAFQRVPHVIAAPLTSGQSLGTRSIGVFYGADWYKNAGVVAGPLAGKRGYSVPGSLFCYDLDTNASHELGHTLYLRHHWTGNAGVRRLEHDNNDMCLMSYATSYALVGGAIQYSTPVADLIAGRFRDAARADLCGRCLLKLRGWHMGRDGTRLPANTTAAAGLPANNPTNYRD